MIPPSCRARDRERAIGGFLLLSRDVPALTHVGQHFELDRAQVRASHTHTHTCDAGPTQSHCVAPPRDDAFCLNRRRTHQQH
jgi:hypothetical protein